MRQLLNATAALITLSVGVAFSFQPPSKLLKIEITPDRHVLLTNVGAQPITGYVCHFVPSVLSPEPANYVSGDLVDAEHNLAPGETRDEMQMTEPRVTSGEAVAVILEDGSVVAAIAPGDPGMIEARISGMFKRRADEAAQATRFRAALVAATPDAIRAAGAAIDDARIRDHYVANMLAKVESGGAARARQWLNDEIDQLSRKRKDVSQ